MDRQFKPSTEVKPNARRGITLQLNDDSAAAVGRVATNVEVAASPEVARLQELVVRGHQEVSKQIVGSALRSIQIGEWLVEIKHLLGHGNFSNWVEQVLTPESGIRLRTAQRYMRLAKNKNELLERASRHFGDGAGSSHAELNGILEGLNAADAVSLLSIRTPPTNKARKEGCELTIDAAVSIQKAALAFYAQISASGNKYPEPHQIFHSRKQANENRKAVESVIEVFEQSLKPQLIVLSYHGAEQWMPKLNGYPRLHFCPMQAEQSNRKERGCILVGLMGEEHFGRFVASFESLGTCFLPSRTTRESSISTHSRRDSDDQKSL